MLEIWLFILANSNFKIFHVSTTTRQHVESNAFPSPLGEIKKQKEHRDRRQA